MQILQKWDNDAFVCIATFTYLFRSSEQIQFILAYDWLNLLTL